MSNDSRSICFSGDYVQTATIVQLNLKLIIAALVFASHNAQQRNNLRKRSFVAIRISQASKWRSFYVDYLLALIPCPLQCCAHWRSEQPPTNLKVVIYAQIRCFRVFAAKWMPLICEKSEITFACIKRIIFNECHRSLAERSIERPASPVCITTPRRMDCIEMLCAQKNQVKVISKLRHY